MTRIVDGNGNRIEPAWLEKEKILGDECLLNRNIGIESYKYDIDISEKSRTRPECILLIHCPLRLPFSERF